MKKLISIGIILIVGCSFAVAACTADQPQIAAVPDYADTDSWAYLELAEGDALADVFFICPTVFSGAQDDYNMSMENAAAKQSFVGAINMEKGIYDENTRFFAPYYRQAGLTVYEMTPEAREQYLDFAYQDAEDAFDYYYKHYNDGRPIVLAGFSQGADMCLRLMKERFNDEKMRDQLIACYAIGWSISQDEIDEYPNLRFAEGADDTGVIIAFNTEAEEVTDSLIVPEGTRTLAINPLTWSTGPDVADRSLNNGACFPNTDGEITTEIHAFTGAYIDDTRGTLKVTDVNEEQFPPQLGIFEDGVYHVYDYQFFYRDLQENVQERIEAYEEAA